jgi:FixJ family two-component response regulator
VIFHQPSLTVFVIDDDAATRSSLDCVLRSVGYNVSLFDSGTRFLENASPCEYGCIILDVRLPGASGLEIQKRLIERNIKMPTIFITGHGDIAMAVQAMKLGAIEFLTKPFRDQEILDAIGRAVNIETARRKTEEREGHALELLGGLSSREQQILTAILDGKLNKQIAFEFNISEATVKVHRRNIMTKLRMRNIPKIAQIFGTFLSNRRNLDD